ncbi:ABC transporter permease subunit [Phytoactinopolyspora limicola]|uniref:ABC transporter permease subunit n=1 Tax=Phytoactinopolyspora limicola TaxID=2715536 RepID=UPI001408602C|nr:ABC transporter permease subunit [Phytoactinopolyspora limicola]
MRWLTWRQFRIPALAAAVLLILAGGYLLSLGSDIREAYDTYQSHCDDPGDCARAENEFRESYKNTLLFLAAGLNLIPVAIGTFWGAPLIARELETGTHRLVWNQTVTRRRWLLTKLAIIAVACVLVAGLTSAMLTWAAAPYDEVAQDRFSTLVFGARHIAPIGYAVLAFTLGAIIGLLIRRTLPAMAVTSVVVIAIQFAAPNFVRPELLSPEAAAVPMTAETINQATNLGNITGGASIGGVQVPGAPDAWVSSTSPLRTADGQPLDKATFNDCLDTPPDTGAGGRFGDAAVCLGDLDLHVAIEYQPGERYWPLQGLETGLFLALSALLASFGVWYIRRVS